MAQTTYDTFWQQRFAARLKALIEAEVDTISSGNAADYATYKERAGAIRGLRAALDEIEATTDEIRKIEAGKK